LDNWGDGGVMSNLQSAVDNLEAKVRELSDSLVNKGDAGTMSGWIPGGGGGGLTTDYCFVGAIKVTIPTKTTNFLKITLGASPSASWVAAMPVTQDADSVVYEVGKNRIYLSGEFGGG